MVNVQQINLDTNSSLSLISVAKVLLWIRMVHPSAASRIKHHLMAYRQINQVNGWLTFLSLVKMTRLSFGLMLPATIYLAMLLMEGLLLMFISRHVINY
ncbi:Uncharacterised protein [Shigella sonnei]|nr:Uncharacterised protein [Shigella sonnei]